MIKCIMFDFDGVLTTDATGVTSTSKYISKVTGIDYDLFKNEYSKYTKLLNYTETRHEEIWDELCKNINQNIDISILYDAFVNIPINEEMMSLVGKLKNKGYKLGMITDNKKDRTDIIIKEYKLDELFEVITISASVGLGKNTNEIFEYTINKLMDNVEFNECVFIDNQEKNLVTPRNMGINSIFYDHNEQNVEKLIEELKSLGIEI